MGLVNVLVKSYIDVFWDKYIYVFWKYIILVLYMFRLCSVFNPGQERAWMAGFSKMYLESKRTYIYSIYIYINILFIYLFFYLGGIGW